MISTPDKTTIAFIGTGTMGSAMAANLINAGFQLVVTTRTKEKADVLVSEGARWADSVGEAVRDADVVITMVGYPDEVEDVYLGDDGVVDNAVAGTYLIDMTTSSPKLAREINAMAAVNDLHALDAPVTGGDVGARTGTLSIMVGGEEEDFQAVLPVLEVMGTSVCHQGKPGNGMLAKLANQVALASSMLGAVECLAFAKAADLDPVKVLSSVQAGSAGSWTLANLAPRMLAEDFDPGFRVKHLCKDLGLALDVAEAEEITLPGLETAAQLYRMLATVGGADMGTQALILVYSDEATCAAHGLDWEAAMADGDDDEDGEGQGHDDGDPHHHHHHHDDPSDPPFSRN